MKDQKFEEYTLKQPEMAWLDKVLCKWWFTTVHSKGNPMTGPMIVEKAKSFDNEMKITHK
jgi:hypothetical protein